MPIIFKHNQRPKVQRHKPDRTADRKSGRAQIKTAIRRLSVRLTDGRQFRAGVHGFRTLRRQSIRAGRSIYRIKETGTSLHRYLRDPKLFLQLAKYIYNRRHLKHLIPLIFVFIYMIVGSILFYNLESNAEGEKILAKNDEYEKEKSFFVKRMEELLVDLVARDNNRRQEFMEEAIDHLSWRLSYDLAPKKSEWSLPTSMYFSGTIFTTIGYGDVACATSMGRIVTVLYALFGIPLMLTTWNEMGKFLYKSINEFIVMLGASLSKFNLYLSSFFSLIYQKIFGLCCLCIIRKRNRTNSQEIEIIEGNKNNVNDKRHFKINSSLLDNIFTHDSKHPDQAGKAVSFKFSMQMEHKTDVVVQNEENINEVEEKNEEDKHEDSDYEESNENSDMSDLTDEEMDQTSPEAPRMHVLIAIACTFSWIFFCAGLFQFWEEWSYWDSLYFMFISLLTIGLGDVNVQRRDLMMLCFIFVMIGLSLVSMCIMVIQLSLEDFYKKIIVKFVTDYQTKVERDINRRRVSLGSIIKTTNQKDKYLLPMKRCILQMVPQSTKRHVIEEVEEEAREFGLKFPPILKNHNIAEQIIFETKKDICDCYSDVSVIKINGIFKKEHSPIEQHLELESLYNFTVSNIQKNKESSTQTFAIHRCENCVQTYLSTEVKSVQIMLMHDVVNEKMNKYRREMTDAAIQTDRLRFSFKKLQTRSRRSDAETETLTLIGQYGINAKTQTDGKFFSVNQEIQTWIPFELVDLYEKDTQTYRFMKSQRIQTPKPMLNDAQTQSYDNSDINGQLYPSVSMLKMFLDPIDKDMAL